MMRTEFMFPSQLHDRPNISTRQYGRLVRSWVTAIGFEPSGCGTHSLRRTKASEIYRETGNLRAVQLLLGHTRADSTVRYLGVELEDALSIAEKNRHLIQTGRRRLPFAVRDRSSKILVHPTGQCPLETSQVLAAWARRTDYSASA